MKVMVIGGCGYIGSMLVPELKKRGHTVSVIDLMWFGNCFDSADPDIHKTDAASIMNLEGYDALIYLGGLSNDPMADFDPMANYHFNAAVPSYLAYVAKRDGVKVFIHGGSCSVYGLLEHDIKASEDLPPRAMTPYGVSKLMAEFGVMRQNGNTMRVVNFRMGTVCGWSTRMRFDLVINAMVKDARLKDEIHVNDISAERPILDIRDAVSAYAQALTNEDLRGTYNLFSHNISIGKLANKVKERISLANWHADIVIHGGHDNRSYTASNKRAVADGVYCMAKLDYTIDSVIQHIAAIKDLEDPIYYNIKTFKNLPAMSLSLVA